MPAVIGGTWLASLEPVGHSNPGVGFILVRSTALPGGPVPGKSLRPKARERSEQKEEKPDQLAA